MCFVSAPKASSIPSRQACNLSVIIVFGVCPVLVLALSTSVLASLPTIEGLGTDIEAAAGETGIATTRLVVVKPFKSLSGFPG